MLLQKEAKSYKDRKKFENVENYYNRKEIKIFYRDVKKGKTASNNMMYIKGKHGNLVGWKEEMTERWREYFYRNVRRVTSSKKGGYQS